MKARKLSRTASNVRWVLLTNIGVNLLITIRGITLARFLGPEAFGIVGIALMMERILGEFSSMGVGTAAVYLQKEQDKILPVALAMKCIFSMVLVVIILLVAPLWANLFGRDEVAAVTRFSALFILADVLMFPSILRAKLELGFKALTMPRLGATAIGCTVAIALAVLGFSYWSIVWGILVTMVTEAILLFLAFPWRVRLAWNGPLARELWGYGRHVVAISFLSVLILQIDNFVVGKLLGLTALGYYTVAFRWGNFASKQVVSAIDSVLFPTFSHWRAANDNLTEKFGSVMRMSAFLYLPISIGMVTIAPEFVQAVLGERWLPAVVPMQLLCVAAIFRSIGNQISKLLLALGRPDLGAWFQLGFLLTLVLSLVPFILWFGLVGASLSVLTASIIWHFLARVLALRRVAGVGFELVGRALLPAVSASGLMGAGVLTTKLLWETTPPSLSFLIVLMTLGVVIYGASTYLFLGNDLSLLFRPLARATRS